MGRVFDQLQPSVPIHGVGDVHQKCVRHRVPAVSNERVDDLLGVVASGAGVPQPERGHAIGMDVLRRAFELCERGDGRTRIGRERMVDLEEQRLVGLDNKWAICHERAPITRTQQDRSGRRPRASTVTRNRPLRSIAGPAGPERGVQVGSGGR